MLLPDIQRRSMGLPPSQGHNNLRLNNTTNLYQSLRLDSKHLNTLKQKQKKYNTNQFTPPLSPILSLKKYKINTKNKPQKYTKSTSIINSIAAPYKRQILSNSQMPSRLVKFNHNRNANLHSLDAFHSEFHHDRDGLSSYRGTAKPPTSFNSNQNHNKLKNEFYRKKSDKNFTSLNRPESNQSHRKTSIVSNMPLINVNSSVVLLNHSPFGLRDPRFGIFHHCSQSISYF